LADNFGAPWQKSANDSKEFENMERCDFFAHDEFEKKNQTKQLKILN
jgi:hypothetical protein